MTRLQEITLGMVALGIVAIMSHTTTPADHNYIANKILGNVLFFGLGISGLVCILGARIKKMGS